MKHEIVNLEPVWTIGMAGWFSEPQPDEIPALWSRFIPALAAAGLEARPSAVSYGICAATDGGFMYVAAIPVATSTPVPRAFIAKPLPGGRYARFTHEGSVRELCHTLGSIVEQWLPAANLTIDPARNDFEYYDDRFDAASASGPVDLYFPIA